MNSLPAIPMADDLVDRIAAEIGLEVAFHIETMYPDAAKAVAWNSCKRSLQGVIRNAIRGAGRAAENGDAEAWISSKRTNRKRLRKMMGVT